MNFSPRILESFTTISEITGLTIPRTLGKEYSKFISDTCEYFPDQAKLLLMGIQKDLDILASFLISRGTTAIKYAIDLGQIYYAIRLFKLGDGAGREELFFGFTRNKTVLMYAIEQSDITSVQFLLELSGARAHIDVKNSKGESALIHTMNTL